MVKTPRQRLSTEPPGAALAGGWAGGAHSGLCPRGCALRPGFSFLSPMGASYRKPPRQQPSSQGRRLTATCDPASEPHTRPAAPSPSLFSATDTSSSWSRAGSNADPAPLAGGRPSAGPSWQQRFPCDFPGANRCIRPQLLRPCTRDLGSPSQEGPSPPESRQQDRTPGGARLWFKLRKGGHKAACGQGPGLRAAPLAGVKALPPVPAQEAARRQRGVTAFRRLGPCEPFRVFSCRFHLRSAVATLTSSLCSISRLRKPVNFGADTTGATFPRYCS